MSNIGNDHLIKYTNVYGASYLNANAFIIATVNANWNPFTLTGGAVFTFSAPGSWMFMSNNLTGQITSGVGNYQGSGQAFNIEGFLTLVAEADAGTADLEIGVFQNGALLVESVQMVRFSTDATDVKNVSVGALAPYVSGFDVFDLRQRVVAGSINYLVPYYVTFKMWMN